MTAFSRCMPIVPGGPRSNRVVPQPVIRKVSARIANPERKDWSWKTLLMRGLWQKLVSQQ